MPNKQSTVLAPVANLTPKASNIKDLLSFATEEYNRSNGDDAIHPIAPVFDPSKSLKFQLQDIALDALPLTPGFGDCQFASDLEKSFKASAATTSKIDNSVTETPVHTVKDDENDKINEELLRRLRVQDSSHDTESPSVEGLTKNQFKAALIHLIEMDDSSIDLACIEMFDKDCLKVIDKSQCVHLYTYNKEKSEWEKSDIGGVLFVVERSSQPNFAFYIVNRQNSRKNFTQPLTSSVELLLRPPHIFFRTTKTVFSLWFFSSIDTERIYNLLKGLMMIYSLSCIRPMRNR
nr:mRNA decapping enzyme 1A [Hymenolepis microstoma]